MKKLRLILVFLILSCKTVEKKEKFNLENHLKSNEWCTFSNENQMCFSFNDNKMIVTENGIDKAKINAIFSLKSDSIVVVKVIGEQEYENHFRMKSMDTIYFSQGDENEMSLEFIRIL